MTAPTPAVERAAEAMEDAAFRLIGRDLGTIYRDRIATEALTAALTDPADPDSLARTLFVLHWSVDGHSVVLPWSEVIEPRRVHWRAVADGLRMMLTGSGS